MAKLRKASAYKRLERPYTRKSKYRKRNFVRANPNNLIVKYEMGSATKKFPWKLTLVADADCQLRHNAVESARKSANKLLETRLQKNFYLKLKLYPHHVLRENPLASGAGADRMSTGMKMSFGKPIGLAAQCKQGKELVDLFVEEKDLATGILALKRMQYKFPIRCLITQTKLDVPKTVVNAKVKEPKKEEPVKKPAAPAVTEKAEEIVEEPAPVKEQVAEEPKVTETPAKEEVVKEKPVGTPAEPAPESVEPEPVKEAAPVVEEKKEEPEAKHPEAPVEESAPTAPEKPATGKKAILEKEGEEAKEILKDLKKPEEKTE